MTTAVSSQLDRISGALLGLAWGDVLGCPVEGWAARDIRRAYGVYTDLPVNYPWQQLRGYDAGTLRRLRPLGLHSDDTQHALALIQVCLTPGGWSAERWPACLVAGMKVSSWRGFGRNFAEAVTRLGRGVLPRRVCGSRSNALFTQIGRGMEVAA